MRLISSLLALLVSALVAGASPAGAQPESPDRIVDELAGIHRTLDRLVQLMEAAEVRHEADLLLRRIGLMERRLAPLQARVGDAQGEVHGLETEVRRMRAMEMDLEAAIDDAVRDGTDQPDSEDREILTHVRNELKQLSEQLEVAELRKRQAEDALADAREEIEVLDDALLEMLEARSGRR